METETITKTNNASKAVRRKRRTEFEILMEINNIPVKATVLTPPKQQNIFTGIRKNESKRVRRLPKRLSTSTDDETEIKKFIVPKETLLLELLDEEFWKEVSTEFEAELLKTAEEETIEFKNNACGLSELEENDYDQLKSDIDLNSAKDVLYQSESLENSNDNEEKFDRELEAYSKEGMVLFQVESSENMYHKAYTADSFKYMNPNYPTLLNLRKQETGTELTLFQRRALSWMIYCETTRSAHAPRVGILSADPGIGKTATCLALCAYDQRTEEGPRITPIAKGIPENEVELMKEIRTSYNLMQLEIPTQQEPSSSSSPMDVDSSQSSERTREDESLYNICQSKSITLERYQELEELINNDTALSLENDYGLLSTSCSLVVCKTASSSTWCEEGRIHFSKTLGEKFAIPSFVLPSDKESLKSIQKNLEEKLAKLNSVMSAQTSSSPSLASPTQSLGRSEHEREKERLSSLIAHIKRDKICEISANVDGNEIMNLRHLDSKLFVIVTYENLKKIFIKSNAFDRYKDKSDAPHGCSTLFSVVWRRIFFDEFVEMDCTYQNAIRELKGRFSWGVSATSLSNGLFRCFQNLSITNPLELRSAHNKESDTKMGRIKPSQKLDQLFSNAFGSSIHESVSRGILLRKETEYKIAEELVCKKLLDTGIVRLNPHLYSFGYYNCIENRSPPKDKKRRTSANNSNTNNTNTTNDNNHVKQLKEFKLCKKVQCEIEKEIKKLLCHNFKARELKLIKHEKMSSLLLSTFFMRYCLSESIKEEMARHNEGVFIASDSVRIDLITVGISSTYTNSMDAEYLNLRLLFRNLMASSYQNYSDVLKNIYWCAMDHDPQQFLFKSFVYKPPVESTTPSATHSPEKDKASSLVTKERHSQMVSEFRSGIESYLSQGDGLTPKMRALARALEGMVEERESRRGSRLGVFASPIVVFTDPLERIQIGKIMGEDLILNSNNTRNGSNRNNNETKEEEEATEHDKVEETLLSDDEIVQVMLELDRGIDKDEGDSSDKEGEEERTTLFPFSPTKRKPLMECFDKESKLVKNGWKIYSLDDKDPYILTHELYKKYSEEGDEIGMKFPLMRTILVTTSFSGIDLTCSSRAIILDAPEPSKEFQAYHRLLRLGQRERPRIVRLYMKNSLRDMKLSEDFETWEENQRRLTVIDPYLKNKSLPLEERQKIVPCTKIQDSLPVLPNLTSHQNQPQKTVKSSIYIPNSYDEENLLDVVPKTLSPDSLKRYVSLSL